MRIKKTILLMAGLAVCIQMATAAIIATKTQLNQVMGVDVNDGCKVVFVKKADNCAYFVDFSEANPSETRLCDTSPVISPLISPDGSLVTFESNGKVYAAKIEENATPQEIVTGFEPHWWIDPAESSTHIVYCTVSGKMSWPMPGSTFTQEIDPVALTATGSPVVLAGNAFTGGLSKSGKYLCHAYTDVVLYDLTKPKEYILIGGVQACNPSITPTTDPLYENQMMILTLGGTVDGTQYDMHEVFYVVNRYDQVLWYVENPYGTEQWQKPEWSTHPDFAIATADRGGAYNVYIVKVWEEASMVRVIDGDNTYPHLWVNSDTSNFIADHYRKEGLVQPGLVISPNPADKKIFLILNRGMSRPATRAVTLKVFTAEGDLVGTTAYRNTEDAMILNTGAYQPGVYLIQVNTGSETISSKILIQ